MYKNKIRKNFHKVFFLTASSQWEAQYINEWISLERIVLGKTLVTLNSPKCMPLAPKCLLKTKQKRNSIIVNAVIEYDLNHLIEVSQAFTVKFMSFGI